MNKAVRSLVNNDSNYKRLIEKVDSIYINTRAEKHFDIIIDALNSKKHVLCEAPICDDLKRSKELFELAKKNNLILMEAIRTAYSTAYERLVLLVKAGKIGKVLSIDATCTDMSK